MMLICPVCRSQNMDSAKFCGNCGNPFTKDSDPTSSLINCPQGHIYSAVYQHCPYCPQPPGEEAISFATRIEEPITAIENLPVMEAASGKSPADFVTRFEQEEPVSFSNDQVPSENGVSTSVTPLNPPTEVISVIPPFETVIESTTPSEQPEPQASTIIATEQSPAQQTAPRSPSLVEPLSLEPDRHTMIVSEHAMGARTTKGMIVGWLITYNKNPDGEDFRIYSGYNRMGANPVCDIVINDDTVSGSHSIIVHRDGKCLIKDDLSRNGTFVNGREITEAHPLQNYDQIRVGNTHLTFVSAQRLSE